MNTSAEVSLLIFPLSYTGDALAHDELFHLILLVTHLTDKETEAQRNLCLRSCAADPGFQREPSNPLFSPHTLWQVTRPLKLGLAPATLIP